MQFFPVMDKAEFSASLLQSSVSHDLSEIMIYADVTAQETFSYYKMLKCWSYLSENSDTVFSGFFDE